MALSHGKTDYKELVQRFHPHAYVDDDGETVRIINQVEVKTTCHECGQKQTKLQRTYEALGSGGTEADAWESAANTLGLVGKPTIQ